MNCLDLCWIYISLANWSWLVIHVQMRSGSLTGNSQRLFKQIASETIQFFYIDYLTGLEFVFDLHGKLFWPSLKRRNILVYLMNLWIHLCFSSFYLSALTVKVAFGSENSSINIWRYILIWCLLFDAHKYYGKILDKTVWDVTQ